jgi:hypothetical protein
MKISNKQIQLILMVLWDSCQIKGHMGGLTEEARLRLYNDIIHQQSNALVDLDDKEEKKPC